MKSELGYVIVHTYCCVVKQIKTNKLRKSNKTLKITSNFCFRSCPQLSCRKMRIVLQHYIRCGRLVAGDTCQVCQQLLGIVTKHATQLCRVEQDQPCPVPLCDGLRRSGKLGLKEEEEMDFVFSA